MVTDFTIKAYLDSKYHDKAFTSYTRIGKDISRFVNRYQLQKVKVIAPIHMKTSHDNIAMAASSVKKLKDFLMVKLRELTEQPGTKKVVQQ
eukprot:CAMPEP_0185593366 /NCGR_PEP_ID=MMETSP0434-20130131/71241_1 /TAXON_ID=626734 ORGANISM="Favella taraikaensis, Strain Fe Narragansett Bay" /NCGR_SAMPLE_ID=MMETSP0434 /ASSEMBLY_ACC=CAM_ASM_000379 /LENGTH=90 /DNA_ID=CAMNT_0028219899 /DNA_START=472 /DNA_END=744 /DNA_ORIENTATION=+